MTYRAIQVGDLVIHKLTERTGIVTRVLVRGLPQCQVRMHDDLSLRVFVNRYLEINGERRVSFSSLEV